MYAEKLQQVRSVQFVTSDDSYISFVFIFPNSVNCE